MQVFVMGAGGQGGPCASMLAHESAVEKVVIGEVDEGTLQKVNDRIGHPKVFPVQVDASNPEQVKTAAQDCNLIVDLSPPWLAVNVMESALELGLHYVNTAFDQPFWDQLAEGASLSLDQAFKDNNLTALLGCGFTPGLTNVLIKHYAEQLDTVNAIKIRVGEKREGTTLYEELARPWNPGWSPKQALLDFAACPHVFREGKFEQLQPFSEIEEWAFPSPVGSLPVSHHAHEEIYSLPYTIGKGIQYCDFKYVVMPQPATLVAMGLASQEVISVDDAKVKPIDVVVKQMPQPGNAFLTESLDDYVAHDEAASSGDDSYRDEEKEILGAIVIEVQGYKHGEAHTYTLHCHKNDAEAVNLFNQFGTALVDVALPAWIGGKQLMDGEAPKGVIFPEELDAEKFIETIKQYPLPYQWEIL